MRIVCTNEDCELREYGGCTYSGENEIYPSSDNCKEKVKRRDVRYKSFGIDIVLDESKITIEEIKNIICKAVDREGIVYIPCMGETYDYTNDYTETELKEYIYMGEYPVTAELKEEIRLWFCGCIDDDFTEYEDDFFVFHKKVKDKGYDFMDADNYAWLNTLFGYDIGIEKSIEICNALEKEGEFATSDLDTGSYNFMKMIDVKYRLNVSFDNWTKKEKKEVRYSNWSEDE